MSSEEKRQSWKSVLSKLTDRIRWAGNLYGKDWRREVAILEPASAAIRAAITSLPRPASELPPSEVPVVVLFSGESSSRIYDRVEAIGRHDPGGWKLDHLDMKELTVHQWAPIPDFDWERYMAQKEPWE